MVRSIAAAVAAGTLCAQGAAFVSQGNLRSPASTLTLQSAGEQAALRAPAARSTGISPAIAGLGLSAMGLSLVAARMSGRTQHKKVECQVVGVSLPLTEKWDPLNLGSTDAKMDRYTAVEIKHGRVSMIAVMGYFLPELFRFPGCEGFGNGLAAFDTIPTEGWVQLIAFIGAHDVLVKPREGGMGSWDLGLGTELLEGISEEELERRQTVERNNGRLAMIAIMGLMVQDGMFGMTPIKMIQTNGWWGPSVDYFIKDIPICDGTALCARKTAAPRVQMHAMERTEERSAAVPFLRYPVPLKGWVGGEKGFDPLGISDALPVYYLREAELKHGRVCMLATVGWIATDLGVRFPGEVFQKTSTIGAHDDLVKAGIMGPFLGAVAAYEVYGGWLFLQGSSKEIKREAGDFFLGKQFLPKDEAGADTMKLKELENGRLAMLAFSGITTMGVISQKPWPFFD